MAWWETVRTMFETALGLSPGTAARILWTIGVLAASVVVSALVRWLIRIHFKDVARTYTASKTSAYVVGIVTALLVAGIWFGAREGVVTYIAILSAGLAIALTGPLVNLAGWIIILLRKPFAVGDRIEINGHRGDVVDIRLFMFSIIEIGNWVEADQSTGRIVHIPNGWIFAHATANATQGFDFIWDEIGVTVTFESDWRRAKQILQEIVDANNPLDSERAQEQIRRTAQRYLVFYRYLTPIVWTRVVDVGVTLTMRYLCEPRKRRSTETRIWETVLERFAAEPGIDFAYPTQRFYDNTREGKSGTGGPGGKPE